MKSICIEVRELIIRAKKQGKTIKDISSIYDVSKRTVSRIWKLHIDTNSVDRKPHTGRPSRLPLSSFNTIFNFIRKKPDKTLNEIIEELDLPIKKSQLQRIIVRAGVSFKKKRYIPKHNKEKMSSRSD